MLALKTWLEQQLARLDEVRHCRSHPVRPEPLGWARSLPRRRPHRTRHQHRGKKYPPDCAQSEKNALFGGHDQGAENWAAIASLVETLQTVWCRARLLRRSPRGVITRVTRVRAQSNEKIKPSEQWDRRSLTVVPRRAPSGHAPGTLRPASPHAQTRRSDWLLCRHSDPTRLARRSKGRKASAANPPPTGSQDWFLCRHSTTARMKSPAEAGLSLEFS